MTEARNPTRIRIKIGRDDIAAATSHVSRKPAPAGPSEVR